MSGSVPCPYRKAQILQSAQAFPWNPPAIADMKANEHAAIAHSGCGSMLTTLPRCPSSTTSRHFHQLTTTQHQTPNCSTIRYHGMVMGISVHLFATTVEKGCPGHLERIANRGCKRSGEDGIFACMTRYASRVTKNIGTCLECKRAGAYLSIIFMCIYIYIYIYIYSLPVSFALQQEFSRH